MSGFKLSHAVLTFYPHYSPEHRDTATFDLSDIDESVTRPGGVCTNIDRDVARELRDALTAWLTGGVS